MALVSKTWGLLHGGNKEQLVTIKNNKKTITGGKMSWKIELEKFGYKPEKIEDFYVIKTLLFFQMVI